jgi:hypothetical protein
MSFAAVLWSIVGCCCLGGSQVSRQRALFGRPCKAWEILSLRIAGTALVAAALVRCVELAGLAVGLVSWFAILTLATFLAAIIFTYGPHRLRGLRQK